MKLEKLDIEKTGITINELGQIKGGTSTTSYKEVGVRESQSEGTAEMEYPQNPDGSTNFKKKGTLVVLPL